MVYFECNLLLRCSKQNDERLKCLTGDLMVKNKALCNRRKDTKDPSVALPTPTPCQSNNALLQCTLKITNHPIIMRNGRSHLTGDLILKIMALCNQQHKEYEMPLYSFPNTFTLPIQQCTDSIYSKITNHSKEKRNGRRFRTRDRMPCTISNTKDTKISNICTLSI